MNHMQPPNQHPALQVFLSDTPEVPKPNANFHLSTPEPILHFQEYIFGESTIKCHSIYGKNITACYSACFMVDEKEIYTIPAQPIVTFHIQVSGDYLARFGNGQEESRFSEGQCRLFWQNEQASEYVLPQEASDYFDLYIRPGHLLDMADRYPVLRQFAMAVATSSPGDIEFFVDRIDQQLLDSVDEILLEVRTFQVSDQRFTHLCEYLLLQWLNIPVEVDPPPADAVKRTFDSAFAHLEDDVFSEEQNSHLWSIARCYNRNQLIDNFYEVREEYLDLKEDRIKSTAREQEVKACYHRVMGESADLLAEAYFWMAQQLHVQKKRFTLTDEEEQILTEVIITVCDQSFELSTPSADQLEFYTSYTQQPYVGDLGMQEFGRILNMVVPDMNLPLDKLDGSRESGAILDQYLQDRLGFTPLSHFTEKGEMNKPPKVVELYHTLMQHMTDELTITDTGDVKKSDLIRILDHAYQHNDVMILLMFEIEHLADQKHYVERQKFNKICTWVMVLEETIEKWYDHAYSDSEQQKLFDRLVHIYMRSGNNMNAVEQKVRKLKEIYDRMVPALFHAGYAMESQTKKHIFMLLAESLIIAAQNPYEEGDR